jgi:hypothetical protein
VAVDDEREAWLGELLDSAAAEYEPDTERLQAMVAARIDESEQAASAGARATRSTRQSRRRMKPRAFGLAARLGLAGIPAGVALATIGAAAALAVGATATIAVTSNHNAGKTVAVLTPSTAAGSTAAPSRGADSSPTAQPGDTGKPTHSVTSTTGASTTSTSATPTSTTGTSNSNDLTTVTASVDQGSNSAWAQLDVVVTIRKPLTAFDVTIKVSECAGLASTGQWDSGAGGEFSVSATKATDGSITYEFELTPGVTVSPGTLTFAAQFNHSTTGWSQAADTYYVSARTATSTSASSVNGSY